METPEKKTLIRERLDEARQFRIKQEAAWMELDHMLDGNHHVFFDRVSNEIKKIPEMRKGEVRRVVNIVRSKLRSVSNMITKNEPAFNVRPTYGPNMSPDDREKAKKDAEVMQHLMAHIYRSTDMQHKFKQVVRLGIKRGISFAQVVWDEDKDEVCINVEDPFNILVDPLCNGKIQKARYIIKSTVCSLDWLKSCGKYDASKLANVQSTTQLSASTYRDSYLSSKFSAQSGQDRVILHEMWERIESDEKEQEDGEKPEMKKKIRVRSYVGDQMTDPIRDETYDYEKYPFFAYFPEIVDGELYPRPYFSDIIGLNKSLDSIVSFVEEYIATVGQGRYLMHETSKLTTQSTGRHGQIFKWAGKTPPTPMDTPRIPIDVIQGHMNNILRFMDEIGGMQFIDADKALSTNTSGVALAQLQAQQSENVGEPTDNLAHFAKELFECILELLRDNYTEARDIPNMNDDNAEVYRVRGRAGLPDGAQDAVGETILGEIPQFRVEIIPGSAFSELQKKADVMELFNLKLVDKETVLDAYKIGAVREVLTKMEQEQAEAQEAQLKQQERQGNIDNMLNREKTMQQQGDNMDLAMAGSIGQQRGQNPELDRILSMMDQEPQQPAQGM